MDITAVRNAYGRTLSSFYTEAEFQGVCKIPMTFRQPVKSNKNV